jgi:hypothetical protein
MTYLIIMFETILGVSLALGFCVLGVYVVKQICTRGK